MNTRIALTILIVCATLASPMAQAKTISRIIAESGLSPEDFDVMTATSEDLLSRDAPQIGREAEWINQDTGSRGTVRIGDVGQNCVTLLHFLRPAGATETRRISTRRCQDESGKWVLAP